MKNSRPHHLDPFIQKVWLGTLSLLPGILLAGCGSSSQLGPGPDISGNWYATDPLYTPTPTNPISGVGFALVDDNGSLSGNVTTYLLGNETPCDSLGFALLATGSIDAANQLKLMATDGIVSFSFQATLDSTRHFFTNGNYTVSGNEAYPMSNEARAGIFAQASVLNAPPSCSGMLKGQLFPALGNYSGTLTASNGDLVDATVSLQQSTTPYNRSSGPGPSIITQGEEYVYASGFAVNGSISLKDSACGVTSGTIQPKEAYLFGNYLVDEFDTNTTYKTGVALAFSIDPASGALTLTPNPTVAEYNGNCFIPYVAGKLTPQFTVEEEDVRPYPPDRGREGSEGLCAPSE
jgi:hypothetical protein